MDFSQAMLDDYVSRWGEVFVVLDSDREYELHGSESYTVDSGMVTVEGMSGDEWVKVSFPLKAIEHVYTHKEV